MKCTICNKNIENNDMINHLRFQHIMFQDQIINLLFIQIEDIKDQITQIWKDLYDNY